jgi:hypothetical protein
MIGRVFLGWATLAFWDWPNRASISRQSFDVVTGVVAAVFEAALAPGVLDENAAHGLGRGGKEGAAAVPVRRRPIVDQAQIRFMYQGGGLKRLAGALLGQSLSGQLAQLVINQRQQLCRSLGIALFDGTKDVGDLAH